MTKKNGEAGGQTQKKMNKTNAPSEKTREKRSERERRRTKMFSQKRVTLWTAEGRPQNDQTTAAAAMNKRG